jgi:hypothetical protein
MTVSRFDNRVETSLAGLLTPGEEILEQGKGMEGLKECAVVLTNQRLVFLRLGTTVFSDLRIIEVRLEDVLTVDSAGGTLRVDARSGTFGITPRGHFKKEVGSWPNLVLAAQAAFLRAAATPDSTRSDSSPGLAEQLSQLTTLRDTGALSEEEFTTAKGRLLGL